VPSNRHPPGQRRTHPQRRRAARLAVDKCGGRARSETAKGGTMKAGIIFTGTGPILLLTSYEDLGDPNLKTKLASKGIKKYIAYEVATEKVKDRYGQQFNVVLGDLRQSDDLRVLDYDGHHVFYNFSLQELGAPVMQEG
jgi:hypothetical protein